MARVRDLDAAEHALASTGAAESYPRTIPESAALPDSATHSLPTTPWGGPQVMATGGRAGGAKQRWPSLNFLLLPVSPSAAIQSKPLPAGGLRAFGKIFSKNFRKGIDSPRQAGYLS